jgi:SAM-dependent methyltransferase
MIETIGDISSIRAGRAGRLLIMQRCGNLCAGERACQTDRVTQTVFDEDTGRQLEAMYRISDVVRRRGLVRSSLGAAPGERILDVGCGPGFLSAELRREVGHAGSVVGVDSSPAMLALAARRCQGLGNVTLHQGDATSLPADPGSYGVAIIPAIASFVAGRQGVSGDDASAWASELNELGERDEYYFASLQFCFFGTRPS